jgi:hypothetical protein
MVKKHNFIKDILGGVCKAIKGIVVVLICAVVIALILYPFNYKISPEATLLKILDNFVVFKKNEKSPKIHLFSQYPFEYGLIHPEGWIGDKEVLIVNQDIKPLWLGVFNSEPRVLHNAKFILFPPKESSLVNENKWSTAWLIANFGQEQKMQCQFKYAVNISPQTGWVIPVPIQFSFPVIGEYEFSYTVISDEYAPFKRSFIVKRK